MKNSLLVTLADENYVDQAKQLFSSAHFNAGWGGDYLLLAHNISDEKLKWFEEKGILIKKCRPLFDGFHDERWRPVTINKLYLFSQEFKKWKNIVFLDADIIVRACLDNLLVKEGFAAARGTEKLSNFVINPVQAVLEKRPARKSRQIKKTYDLNSPAFSSGVMAFNTEIIKENTLPEIKNIFEYYSDISAAEEELILNLFFYGRWIELPKIYNTYPHLMSFFYNIPVKEAKAAVLHFTRSLTIPHIFRSEKPWDKESPFFREWHENLKKSELMAVKEKNNPAQIWTDKQTGEYLKYCARRGLRFFYRKLLWKSYSLFDRAVGLFGIYLKNNFPKLYYGLKAKGARRAV